MKKTLEEQLLESLTANLNVLWEDWNKVNHHDKTNGLSRKAVNAYRHEHPGSHLQTAVTTKPSKLKAGSKAAKRRKSFCARMSGNKGPMKKPNGKPTPKALALRRWHCESLDELLVTARERIYEAEGEESGLKHLTPHLARDILDQMEKEGVHAIVKSIEWGDGGAKELIAMIKRDLEQVANNVSEGWSQKYKSSINCSHPKGFSQKAHCAGKKKHNESHEVMEMTCPDCGMCQSHGTLNEIKKGAKDSNGFTKCWPGHHASGTKKGKNGGQVRNCVPNEGAAEGVPQPGESSGAPKQFGPDAKIQTRQMTVKQIISSIPGLPYYNNVVDDWDAKDYSWGVTKKVIEYATYLKEHPKSLSQLPPILVLNGKFEDGAHRVSAIWLLQQRMDPKNPLWKNAKLNVQFVKQGVAEGAQQAAIAIAKRESGKYTKDGKRKK